MKFTRRKFFSGIFAAPVAAVTLAPTWKRFVEDTGYWWEDITVLIKRFLKFGKWGWGTDTECPTAIPDDQGAAKPARPDLWASHRVYGGSIRPDLMAKAKREAFIPIGDCCKIKTTRWDSKESREAALAKLKDASIDMSKLSLDEIDARKITVGNIDVSDLTAEAVDEKFLFKIPNSNTEEHDPWELAYER